MRYGIFSDVHGNLEALEAVIASYAQESIGRYFCAGDIVGYGANPKECIKIVRDIAVEAVAGNHDFASSDILDMEYFNPEAKEAALWTSDTLGEGERSFLKSLKLVYECSDFIMVHGTLEEPGEFNYILDPASSKTTFDRMSKDLCFLGHSHIPGVFIEDGQIIDYSKDNFVEISPDKKYIVNVGSVGQPRDRNNRACYCIYDSCSNSIEIKRAAYDIKKAQAKIIDSRLPIFLAMRLTYGI